MSLKKEIERKWIHFTSALIPLAIWYGWVPNQFTLHFLSFFIILMGFVEFFRLKTKWGGELFNRLFKQMLRPHEKNKLTAAFFQLIAYFICFFVAEKELAPIVMDVDAWIGMATLACLFVSISDGLAAMFGVAFGKPWVYGKTMIGTASFFISAVLLNVIFQFVNWRIGIAGAVIATVVELLPSRFSDNFSVPVSALAVMIAMRILIS